MGRLTALSKSDGGVRGIVAVDIVRRLVAQTISQQLFPPLSVQPAHRAGCECVAHILQGLTEIDGVVAFDLISRRAMLQGLRGVDDAVLPFARLFYGQQSQYFWENDSGEVHIVLQGGRARRRKDAVVVLPRSTCHSRRCVPQFSPWRSKPGRVGHIHDLWRNPDPSR